MSFLSRWSDTGEKLPQCSEIRTEVKDLGFYWVVNVSKNVSVYGIESHLQMCQVFPESNSILPYAASDRLGEGQLSGYTGLNRRSMDLTTS